MQKLTGIHFYINIVNYNSIIRDEEKKTRNVTQSIRALDTFFSSIESYGKKVYPNKLVVEKITGSRLHMYVADEIEVAFEVVKAVSVYAYNLSGVINKDISQYKMLKDFIVNIGVAFGKFYNYEFVTKEGFSETTTIGYAANYAAKLQSLSGCNKISISEDIYCILSADDRKNYERVDCDVIKKYGQEKYYTAPLEYLKLSIRTNDEGLNEAIKYANSNNEGNIDYSGVRKLLNFSNLSNKQCKKLEGIPVFADVRGFTSQFKDDDSNLDEMAQKTCDILTSMYRVSTGFGGIHVQFQGDRELSLYHNVPGQIINGVFQAEQTCFKSAILASMRMVDAVKSYAVHIGVGEDFGILFATKIGARGEKDNILLGDTVIQADVMEENNADKDQIAITKTVYEGLKKEDEYLASQFKLVGNHYVTTIGYQQYNRIVSFKQQSANTARNNYNGAWGVSQ